MDERRGLVVRRDNGEGCVDESASSTSNDRFSVGLVMPDPSFSVLLTRVLDDLAEYEDFLIIVDVSSPGRGISVRKCTVDESSPLCVCVSMDRLHR